MTRSVKTTTLPTMRFWRRVSRTLHRVGDALVAIVFVIVLISLFFAFMNWLA